MTTANSAQSKLGIVRITLRTIRVGQSNQRGAMVRAAPTDNTIEMMMASRVETRAICTVSSRPSSVRSRMDQSGGKKLRCKPPEISPGSPSHDQILRCWGMSPGHQEETEEKSLQGDRNDCAMEVGASYCLFLFEVFQFPAMRIR